MSQVREAGLPALPAVYRDLLLPSFPADELVTEEALAAGLADGSTLMHIVGDDDEPLAAAITDAMEPSQALLLSYLATKEQARGSGLGTRLLAGCMSDVVERFDPSLVLAEVEHPDHHRGDAHHGDPAARLRFYARQGARILDVPYVQGSVAPGQPPVYGLLLLALHVRSDQLEPGGGALLPTGELQSALSGGNEPEPGYQEHLVQAAGVRVRLLPVENFRQAAVVPPPVSPGVPPA